MTMSAAVYFQNNADVQAAAKEVSAWSGMVILAVFLGGAGIIGVTMFMDIKK